jgi:integrase
MARLLDAAPGLKCRAALSVAYGAGLRASEVVSLKISDIDSERMVIRVEQGKSPPPRRRGGGKDRYVILSPHLLELLRAWCKAALIFGVPAPLDARCSRKRRTSSDLAMSGERPRNAAKTLTLCT